MATLLCLWTAILLGILYLFFSAFEIVFGAEGYGLYAQVLSRAPPWFRLTDLAGPLVQLYADGRSDLHPHRSRDHHCLSRASDLGRVRLFYRLLHSQCGPADSPPHAASIAERRKSSVTGHHLKSTSGRGSTGSSSAPSPCSGSHSRPILRCTGLYHLCVDPRPHGSGNGLLTFCRPAPTDCYGSVRHGHALVLPECLLV